MKLATLNDGSRDGQLAVVSRDLATAHLADGIAPTLQRALDDWAFVGPQLEDLALRLNQGKARHAFPFDARRCLAPLPRAYQWVRVSDADGSPAAPGGRSIRHGRGDAFLGACDDALFGSEDWGPDLEAVLAAVVDDLPAGAAPEHCGARIRLLMLAGEWVLRTPPSGDGFDPRARLQARPATSFCPVAVTPDELGDAWRETKLHLPVQLHCNGRRLSAGTAPSGIALADAIALLARIRSVGAGAVVAVDAEGAASGEGQGVAARRAREDGAEPAEGAMRFGDRVRVEIVDAQGASVFGAIDQAVGRTPG